MYNYNTYSYSNMHEMNQLLTLNLLLQHLYNVYLIAEPQQVPARVSEQGNELALQGMVAL